jgi:hypothetical protein
MDRWRQGFATRHEVFEWIATSRFFDPRRVSNPADPPKVKRERTMYYEFQAWAKELRMSGVYDTRPPLSQPQYVVEEALDCFDRRSAYYDIVLANERRIRLKQTFTGHLTAEYLGLDVSRDWRPIKHVMDAIRQEVGEDALAIMEKDEIREAIIRTKAQIDSSTGTR